MAWLQLLEQRRGKCGTDLYSILNFTIQHGRMEEEQSGRCWSFAQWSATSSVYSSSCATVGAVISASLTIWLT